MLALLDEPPETVSCPQSASLCGVAMLGAVEAQVKSGSGLCWQSDPHQLLPEQADEAGSLILTLKACQKRNCWERQRAGLCGVQRVVSCGGKGWNGVRVPKRGDIYIRGDITRVFAWSISCAYSLAGEMAGTRARRYPTSRSQKNNHAHRAHMGVRYFGAEVSLSKHLKRS